MANTTLTIVGNLVDDPELRFTPQGVPVTNFRLASTPRIKSGDEWVDGETLFVGCTVWRQQAENVAESLRKGLRVVVTGQLRARSYETREGEKRTVWEVEAEDVAASLAFAIADVKKVAPATPGARVAALPV